MLGVEACVMMVPVEDFFKNKKSDNTKRGVEHRRLSQHFDGFRNKVKERVPEEGSCRHGNENEYSFAEHPFSYAERECADERGNGHEPYREEAVYKRDAHEVSCYHAIVRLMIYFPA